MKKLEYWNVKKYASERDKKACEKSWDNEIELKTDKFGRVFDEGAYIVDIVYQESCEY